MCGIHVYMFVCVNMCVRVYVHTHACGGQGLTFHITLSLSTLWFQEGSQVTREPLASLSLTSGFFTEVLMIQTQVSIHY